jgi:hypothetical protein
LSCYDVDYSCSSRRDVTGWWLGALQDDKTAARHTGRAARVVCAQAVCAGDEAEAGTRLSNVLVYCHSTLPQLLSAGCCWCSILPRVGTRYGTPFTTGYPTPRSSLISSCCCASYLQGQCKAVRHCSGYWYLYFWEEIWPRSTQQLVNEKSTAPKCQ